MKVLKWALFFPLPLLAAVSLKQDVQVNLLKGSSTVSTQPSWEACLAEAQRLANLSTQTSGTATYTCQTERRRVIATYSANPPPPPPPPPASDWPPLLSGDADQGPLLKFAETWDRNWNFDGHQVTSQFTGDYGNWDYADTTYEPWLFDRSSVGYILFKRTGDARWKDKFLSDFAWYRSHINAQGYFTPKVLGGENDTKYGYVTPFLRYEQLTGDTQYRPIAKAIYDSWVREWPDDFNPKALLWTERELAFALEAAVSYYEITKDAGALARARALVNQWTQAAGASGAPQVTYTQHEGGGPGGTTPTSLTNSPWMSALYFQAAHRLYGLVGDANILEQASKYFDWLDVNGLYDGGLAHPEVSGYTFPRYLTGPLIGDAGYDEGNADHAIDVAGFVRFAIYAKGKRGEPTAKATQRAAELARAAQWDFGNWTRDTAYLPKYRLSPPRKFNWWMRGASE